MIRLVVLSVLVACVFAGPKVPGKMTAKAMKKYVDKSPFIKSEAVSGKEADALLTKTIAGLEKIALTVESLGKLSDNVLAQELPFTSRVKKIVMLQKNLMKAFREEKDVARDFTLIMIRLMMFGAEGDLPCASILEAALSLRNCSEKPELADATVPAVIKNCSAGPVLNAAYGEDMKCKLKKMNALVKDLKDMGITETSTPTEIQTALARIHLYGITLHRDTKITFHVLKAVKQYIEEKIGDDSFADDVADV